MGKNQLIEGQPRLGWLIDGDPNTPLAAAMLQDSGEQIVLTIPVNGWDGPYARWCSNGGMFADDPDRTEGSYDPPQTMMFMDSDGVAVLVGCRSSGMVHNFGGTDVGHRRISADIAVLGGRTLDYEKINGLRTELPALAQWSGITSLETRYHSNEDRLLRSVNLRLESPPEVALDDAFGLTLMSSWRAEYSDDQRTVSVHDVARFRTLQNDAVSWDEHLRVHEAMRDLLSLSAWRSLGYSSVEAHRTDDPERVESGHVIGESWAPVISHRLYPHEPWKKPPAFLFYFDDIGTKGVSRWLDIRTRFHRTVEPLRALAYGVDDFLETRMLYTGIAIEALGFQLESDNSTGRMLTRRGDDWITYPDALDRIADDLPFLPLKDDTGWKDRSVECYNGVKHPNRPKPDTQDMITAYREGVLLLRAWLAARLGCLPGTIKSRLVTDQFRDVARTDWT